MAFCRANFENGIAVEFPNLETLEDVMRKYGVESILEECKEDNFWTDSAVKPEENTGILLLLKSGIMVSGEYDAENDWYVTDIDVRDDDVVAWADKPRVPSDDE